MQTDGSTQSNMTEAGFRSGDKGTHTSRTMMLTELTELLEAIPETAPRQAYADAIIEDNILGKQTTATRKLTNQRLGELYGLTPTLPIFAVLRRAWARDEAGRPLIALLCALARDPLLKASQQAVLPLPAGAELMRSSSSGALRAATGHRLNESILDKVARNTASSWSQSGHLEGRVRKIRQRVTPTPGALAYAAWLGTIEGLAGEHLLNSNWARVLDHSPVELLDLAFRAKAIGLLNVSAGGGIVEIDVRPLETTEGAH